MHILAINPGSTSTKISLYQDGDITEEVKISHSTEELQQFPSVMDQLEFRRNVILEFLREKNINPSDLDAVVGRGGILPPVSAGAYEVNEEMIHYLQYITTVEHPSNLGALLANGIQILAKNNTLALIYDPVSVDEFSDIARISGLNGVSRKSLGHALNMRAVAMKVAEDENLNYDQATLIVAHLGGGNSISFHHKGRMIDSISDDEGPFAAERTGGIPLKQIIALCYEKSKSEMLRLYKREGGLKSYAGTSDVRIIEERIKAGDRELKMVYDAFIYQLAKGIGSLSTITAGKVDRIILTGGIAHSDYVVDELKQKVSFIAPIIVEAGEHEMIALSKGAERVVLGKEKMHQFNTDERKQEEVK